MTFSDRVLEALGPAMREAAGDLLEPLLDVLCAPMGAADALLRPTAGRPGTPLSDLATTPYPRWVAQLAGVNLPASLSDAQVRILAGGASASVRGTPAAIIAAAQTVLTGSRRVRLVERDGDPYNLTVHTYSAQTPDPAALVAAVLTQKPVGIRLTHVVDSGQAWADVKSSGVTYGQLKAQTVKQVREAVPA